MALHMCTYITTMLTAVLCCGRRSRRAANDDVDGRGDATASRRRPHLVIVGASFGGLSVARDLSGGDLFDCSVVEPKDFVEYTPSTLKAMVHPQVAASLQVPIAQALGTAVKHVAGTLQRMELDAHGPGGTLHLQHVDGTDSRLHFDACVLATGSWYPSAAKANVTDISGAKRLHDFSSLASRLQRAGSVVIVGGGPVGVELAAELVISRPGVRVRIISSAPRVLDHFPLGVSKAAEEWLLRHGVQLSLSERVSNIVDDASTGRTSFTTTRGGSQMVDALVMCAGGRAASEYMAASPAPLRDAVLPNGRINVTSTFRVNGAEGHNVFAIGDVAAHPLMEPAMAHTAEKHAICVVHSLTRIAEAPRAVASSKHDCVYPSGLTGAPTAPVIAAISLGPYESIIMFDWLILSDGYVGTRLGAAVKWVIERTKLMQMQRSALGIAFWQFGDHASVAMHTYMTMPLARALGISSP